MPRFRHQHHLLEAHAAVAPFPLAALDRDHHARLEELRVLERPATADGGLFVGEPDAVPEPTTALFEDVTSYPEVREDLAVIVADTITAAQVREIVRRAGAPLLAGAEVFDVYRDAARLGEGNVSLALRLTYRAPDRTLTDAEVAAQREQIVEALARQLQGRIRGGT